MNLMSNIFWFHLKGCQGEQNSVPFYSIRAPNATFNY